MRSIASLYCCIYGFLIHLIIMISNNNNNEFLFNYLKLAFETNDKVISKLCLKIIF